MGAIVVEYYTAVKSGGANRYKHNMDEPWKHNGKWKRQVPEGCII